MHRETIKAWTRRRWVSEGLLFAALFAVCLGVAFRVHFDGSRERGRGVFHSDKSIYYVYLPATFIYGWDVKKFPSHCDTVYEGFILDYRNGKIVNKMTCGVALLWSPFFLATHAAVKLTGGPADGFSLPYRKMAVVIPVIFLVLGLFFLKRFLEYDFPQPAVITGMLFLLAGTNLLYYGIQEGLMSHVHSFFLFALFLFTLRRLIRNEIRFGGLYAGIAAVFALAVLVRPTNVLILLWFFLLDTRSLKDIKERIRLFFRFRNLAVFLVVCFTVFLPQMIYWRWVSGHFLHYSYGSEGFFYWKNPVILPLWFSTFNGLFLYSPMVLLFMAGIAWMILRKEPNGLLQLLTFALVTWISGSWHMWFFGGSFGSRPFVEYYALFAIGFVYLLDRVSRWRNLFLRSLLYLVMALFSYYSVRLTLNPSWYTGSVWDWDEFKSRLADAGVLSFSRDTYTFKNDFENISFDPAVVKTRSVFHSRNLGAMLDSRYPFSALYIHPVKGILDHDLQHVTATLWTRAGALDSTGAHLVAAIEDAEHRTWLYHDASFNASGTKTGEWREVKLSFTVPQWLSSEGNILKIYIWNRERKTFFIDDVRVVYN